jgi:P27 family predicted phage terminase small subunit
MGRRGPMKDPAGTNRPRDKRRMEAKAAEVERDAQVLELITTPGPPALPEGIEHPRVVEAWERLWQADIARYIHGSDMPTVERLFRLTEEFERAMEVYRRAPAVKGSQGQLRVNPFLDAALKIEAAIHRLENEIGLTPMARARLGLTNAVGHLTVEQINQMAERRTQTDGNSDKPAKPQALLDGWAPA